MRKALAGAVIMLGASFAAGAAPEKGLVAHYPFDEGTGTVVRDASGNGHNGTIHGARYVKWQQGCALEFNGDSDYVEIPSSDQFKLPDAVTVEAWINPKVAVSGVVVSKNGGSTYRVNYCMSLQENGVNFQTVKPPMEEKMSLAPPIAPDKWRHLAGVYDGQDLKTYVDGKLGGVNHLGKLTMGTFDGPLNIGATFYAVKLGGFFSGQIDDVRIYSRALSDAEVFEHYQAAKDSHVSKLSAMSKLVSAFEKVDTTPPTVSLPSPAADSTAGADAIIGAKFADAGSGIDLASAQILLDGQEVTAAARITKDGFTLQPPKALAKGIHRVAVAISDHTGNRGNRLSWIFGVDAPVLVEAKFEKGVFLVNGEPYFTVGFYGGSIAPQYEKLGYMAQAGEAGINYQFMGQGMSQEDLDTYLRHGIKVLMALDSAAAALAQGDTSQMDGTLKLGAHPSILGWCAEYEHETQEPIVAPAYRYIKEKDPRHPMLFMHTWAGRFSDAYFVYDYPILNPLLTRNDIIQLYDNILKKAFDAAAAEGKNKQVWFISQAFDYRALLTRRGQVITLEGGFRPSREEMRAMNYLALAKGVKGLQFYSPCVNIPGTDYCDDIAVQPRQWTEALKIAREVRHLTPVLALGEVAQTVRLEQPTPAIHYRELVHDGVHTLIAVNVERDLVLAKWVFDNPAQPKVLFEDRKLSQKLGAAADLFGPLEVHVYQW